MSSPGTEHEHNGDVDKHVVGHDEKMHDHDVIGDRRVSTADAEHAAELTEDEAALARKLRVKIDFMIMPWVILVRWQRIVFAGPVGLTYVIVPGVFAELH